MENGYLSLEEVQEEELKILKNVTDFMEKNNLTYYLYAGTLLGAIRHKGFIPWDDDVDIFMPRDDYNKFIELFNNKEIDEKYELKATILNNTKNPYAKVINKNIVVDGESAEDKNLWIDIFPLDGSYNDEKEYLKLAKKINFYGVLRYINTTKIKYILKQNRNPLNKLLKIILKPITMILPMKHYAKKIEKWAMQNSYNECEYVGVIVWGYDERWIKEEIFKDTVEVEFENEKFNAPSGYDLYLKNNYGDYMKLPPHKARNTHKIMAKRLN